MARRTLPTVEYLRECFHYDPESGDLTWKQRPPHHFNKSRYHKWFNTVYAGLTVRNIGSHGYYQVCIRYQMRPVHRVIFKLMSGRDPTNDIDHVNGNRLDNRWSNLREATRSQNMCNKRIAKNTTGFRGVTPRGRLYAAQIAYKGKNKKIGYYKTPEEAHAAYCKAAKEIHGEFANFG